MKNLFLILLYYGTMLWSVVSFGHSKDNEREIVMNTVFICGVYITFSMLGLTLMKLGSGSNFSGIHIPIVDMHFSLVSLIGMVCYGISFILYTVVVSKMKIGITLPTVSGIVTILTVMVAMLIFREKISMMSLIGIGTIIVGIVVVNLGRM